MAALRGLFKDIFSRALRVADVPIKNGRVVSTTQNKTPFWSKWCTYMQSRNIDLYLQSVTFDDIIKNICGFSGRVREGHLGLGNRVFFAQVQIVVRAIEQTYKLEKGYNSLYQSPEKHLKPLELMLAGITREDKLTVPQIAFPVVVPQQMDLVGMAADATDKEQAVGDLGLIAFFYLVCVGEYTQKKNTP